ncbi:unnamed protein product [Caenorhabditis bovis]|uniref:Major facilitator superfamily (MFS) profile domain-containing protein n=1 Tax=Caenorhabditis bovis TaxID=2654633 RepID=A0A8S1EIU4_9PELO|nr:unnamed protein product [Caenorhabditis bovis]
MGFFKKVITFIKNLRITVEPLILILAACNTAIGIVSPGLKQAKMVRTYPAPPDLHGKALAKYYNKKMVMWDNYYEYVNLPIACVFGVVYGAYSDHRGRKLPLLIGIVSVLVSNLMNFLMYNEKTDLSLHYTYATAAVAGILGDFLLTMSCVNAYVADEFEDKIQLSYRMVVVSILFSFGSFLSSRFVRHLIDWTSKPVVMLIAEGGYLLSFVLALIILRQKPPRDRNALIKYEDNTSDVSQLPIETEESLAVLIKRSFLSLYDSAKIFVAPRDGHGRLFLYLCFGANFLDQFVWGEEKGLLGTYVRLPPFNWNTKTYASYRSWRPIVQIAGMTIGVTFFKRLCKLRDTVIIVFAILSMAGCVLMIGLAQASWMIFASLAPGSLHGLLNPMSYTFLSCIVETDEIGKVYAVSSIAQKLAGIAQSLVLQNIYIITVDWYQGFVWLLMALIAFIAAGVYSVVHIVAKKENIGS